MLVTTNIPKPPEPQGFPSSRKRSGNSMKFPTPHTPHPTPYPTPYTLHPTP
ncbi:MAG: hypothetical protein F6J93_24365 [Oscillatoria sp. SIO1A7]|nr:hypothetical protein [Oscillatoria sp. SIO1A7]